MPEMLNFLIAEEEKDSDDKSKNNQNTYGTKMLTVVLVAAVIVVVVIFTTLGQSSDDSGRIGLRSTKVTLKTEHSAGPPITEFYNYEICPAYYEDRTEHSCGDTLLCSVEQSCNHASTEDGDVTCARVCEDGTSACTCPEDNEQDGSSGNVYVLVSEESCESKDGLEPIKNVYDCFKAGVALAGETLPGENRTFTGCQEGDATCLDVTDYAHAGPCWITGTSGSLKFSDIDKKLVQYECGSTDGDWASPSACVCKQTQQTQGTTSVCQAAECQQPDNMNDFFTQVLIQHYGLNNVDNLQVSDADEFTYEFAGQTFSGSRNSILQCDGQTGRLAVFRACECANGLVSLVCDGGTQACEMCNSGFTLVDGTCTANTCTCANGIAAAGADCQDDGAVKCTSCEPGFTLNSEKCTANQCSCQDGTAATGADCLVNGEKKCTGCSSPFTLVNGTCICGEGAHMEGGTCTINQCNCYHGTGATGADCPDNGAYKCVSCNSCYHIDGNSCDENLLPCQWCHPSDSTVAVQHACDTGLCLARRRMDELKIGDTVESGVGIFEPVLAFLHRDGDAKGEFFSFEFVNNSMEISGNHYMYANGKRVLPGTVKIGDMLSNGETITDIKQVSKAGLFHPITLSTKLMVNDVQVSTNFEWGGIDVSYIENIFGWVAKAMYTIGMPIDVAEDTLWAPLIVVRDNWSFGSQQILKYLPKTLHPVGIVLGGLLLIGYTFPHTALFALITMATFKLRIIKQKL